MRTDETAPSDAVIVDVSALIYVLVLSGALDSQSKTIVTMVRPPTCRSFCSAAQSRRPAQGRRHHGPPARRDAGASIFDFIPRGPELHVSHMRLSPMKDDGGGIESEESVFRYFWLNAVDKESPYSVSSSIPKAESWAKGLAKGLLKVLMRHTEK